MCIMSCCSYRVVGIHFMVACVEQEPWRDFYAFGFHSSDYGLSDVRIVSTFCRYIMVEVTVFSSSRA